MPYNFRIEKIFFPFFFDFSTTVQSLFDICNGIDERFAGEGKAKERNEWKSGGGRREERKTKGINTFFSALKLFSLLKLFLILAFFFFFCFTEK